jgi:hypothetical protein
MSGAVRRQAFIGSRDRVLYCAPRFTADGKQAAAAHDAAAFNHPQLHGE